ncbi:histone-arginine methyltransferase CARM1-like [Neovison vison]|uniref:histone-arginine methyltransferase CARM1-like n=1 Tax=Neovison vison TaxID=452646 RepID=UPI001CEFFEFD|nr:histone-arginine methyltransferase CARM1-like [Neogale vison]
MCPLATILHWSEFTSGGGHALALRGHVREGQAGAAVLASCLKSNKETEAGGTEQNAWGLSGESGFVLPMTKLRKERSRHETLRQWWLEPQQEQPCNMGPAVEDQHKQCPGPRQAHGKVVLDVGCGSGILSFFAVQAGARRVYAVEASSVAQYAEMLVKNNHLSDKIIVVPGKIEDISLPEAVDVIISEPMGYMLFNERMLESYLHSKKWLKANGMMFPTFGDIHLAPFSDEQLYMEHYSRANFWYQHCFYGVNLSSLRAAAADEYFRQPIVDTFDIRILMARTVKYTVNFMDAEEADLHRVEIPFVFQLTQSGLVHGLAFWFDVAFVGSLVTVWLSTAPTEPLTHWYQVRCLLHTPLFAREGETLSGKVLFVANRRQSYDIQIVALVNQTGFRSGNILDLKNPFFRFA